MCSCSPESQPYLGLHQEKQDLKVEGGDYSPLVRSGESPPGVLRPALGSLAQERRGPATVCPGEGHENDQRDGTPLL